MNNQKLLDAIESLQLRKAYFQDCTRVLKRQNYNDNRDLIKMNSGIVDGLNQAIQVLESHLGGAENE